MTDLKSPNINVRRIVEGKCQTRVETMHAFRYNKEVSFFPAEVGDLNALES